MTATVIEILGGPRLFRPRGGLEPDLATAVRKGFPVKALEHVLATLVGETITQADIYDVVGTARTLQRKRANKSHLSREESDRLARLARIVARAEQALGTGAKAREWLGTANDSLGGARPITMLDSDTGALAVDQVLGRIEHGIPS